MIKIKTLPGALPVVMAGPVAVNGNEVASERHKIEQSYFKWYNIQCIHTMYRPTCVYETKIEMRYRT